MALKACKECNKNISSSVSECPQCGVKWPALSADQMRARGLIILLLISLPIFYVFYLIKAPSGTVALPPPQLTIEQRISPVAINSITKEQYPKTFRLWGADKVSWINRLQRPAARYILENNGCDYVESVSLSPSRSAPPSVVVFNVDCRNGARYYAANDMLE